MIFFLKLFVYHIWIIDMGSNGDMLLHICAQYG